MRYRDPSDSTDPERFFTSDLRLHNVSIGQEPRMLKITSSSPFLGHGHTEFGIVQAKRWT